MGFRDRTPLSLYLGRHDLPPTRETRRRRNLATARSLDTGASPVLPLHPFIAKPLRCNTPGGFVISGDRPMYDFEGSGLI